MSAMIARPDGKKEVRCYFDYHEMITTLIGTDAEKVTLRVLNPTSKLFLRLRIQQNP
jgi:hypothetical protein